MVEFHDVAECHAVWLPQCLGAKVRAYRAKNGQKIMCSDYIFDNSCKKSRGETTLEYKQVPYLNMTYQ